MTEDEFESLMNFKYTLFLQECLTQRSETFGSQVRCSSFQDCIWLSGLQTSIIRLSSKYCKTANTSIKAFQGYHWRCIQLSNCSIGQGSDEIGTLFGPMRHQCTAKQRIPPEWLSKVTTGVVFSCHEARLANSVSNQKILWFLVIPIPNCMVLMEAHFFLYGAFMALSAKKVSDPWPNFSLNLNILAFFWF